MGHIHLFRKQAGQPVPWTLQVDGNEQQPIADHGGYPVAMARAQPGEGSAHRRGQQPVGEGQVTALIGIAIGTQPHRSLDRPGEGKASAEALKHPDRAQLLFPPAPHCKLKGLTIGTAERPDKPVPRHMILPAWNAAQYLKQCNQRLQPPARWVAAIDKVITRRQPVIDRVLDAEQGVLPLIPDKPECSGGTEADQQKRPRRRQPGTGQKHDHHKGRQADEGEQHQIAIEALPRLITGQLLRIAHQHHVIVMRASGPGAIWRGVRFMTAKDNV